MICPRTVAAVLWRAGCWRRLRVLELNLSLGADGLFWDEAGLWRGPAPLDTLRSLRKFHRLESLSLVAVDVFADPNIADDDHEGVEIVVDDGDDYDIGGKGCEDKSDAGKSGGDPNAWRDAYTMEPYDRHYLPEILRSGDRLRGLIPLSLKRLEVRGLSRIHFDEMVSFAEAVADGCFPWLEEVNLGHWRAGKNRRARKRDGAKKAEIQANLNACGVKCSWNELGDYIDVW
jgi:hypothetical protein